MPNNQQKFPLSVILILFCLTLISNAQDTELMTCDSDGPGYFKFMGRTMGRLKLGNPISIKGKCFDEITATLIITETHFNVQFVAKNLQGFGCTELLIASSGKTSKYHLILMAGTYIKEFEMSKMTQAEKDFVLEEGFFILRLCDDVRNLPRNLWMTLKLFIGGWMTSQYIPIFGTKIPEFQLIANIDFVNRATGYQWKFRGNTKKVLLDPKYIRSGDFFGMTRFDGVANLAHVISGSRAGHCAMALWDKDILYVIETEDGGGNIRKGVKRTEWHEWLEHADRGDNNVVLLPLNKQLSQKFNVEQTWTSFYQIQGLPYGYQNFIFGAVDTESENRPDFIDDNFISIVISALEPYFPDLMSKIFLEAWNKRLNTNGLTMGQIWDQLYLKKTSLEKLTAMVEEEDWEYSVGRSLICSALVAYLYKAAGLFGNLKINSPEFTPLDLVQLNFYDLQGDHLAEACKGNMPRGYCQIMGMFDMDLGNINFVEPYDNMAEKCPTVPPYYERKEGC